MKHNILGDKKTRRYDEGLIEVVNAKYEREQREDNSGLNKDQEQKNNNPFFINLSTKVYKLNNVFSNGDICSFAWDRELLDGGKFHTQNEWIGLTNKLPAAKGYYASLLALYENREGPQADLVEEIRQMFAKDFKNNWMMTSTKVIYMPEDLDEIIHTCKGGWYDSKISLDFVGPSVEVNDKNNMDKEMAALLGTLNNCDEISKIFEWVTGKKILLWRLKDKPVEKSERAVVFGVDGIV
ncbi:hypothetical protein HY837_04120, partial [archaeon]|nr:hypothetical protein [archaeon]